MPDTDEQKTDGCTVCGNDYDIQIKNGAEHIPMGEDPIRVCSVEGAANIHYLND